MGNILLRRLYHRLKGKIMSRRWIFCRSPLTYLGGIWIESIGELTAGHCRKRQAVSVTCVYIKGCNQSTQNRTSTSDHLLVKTRHLYLPTIMDSEMAQMMLQQAGGGIPRDLSTPDK